MVQYYAKIYGLSKTLLFADGVEVWEEDDAEEDLNAMEQAFQVTDTSSALVLWICQFLVLLQRKHRLSETAIALLLSFFAVLFKIFAKMSPKLRGLLEHFPSTLYKLHKLVSPGDKFTRYVACEKCYTIYQYSDCVDRIGTIEKPRPCFRRNLTLGRPCKGRLLKYVELSRGKKVLYPIKVYCYAPLHLYMQSLLGRQGFIDMCDHWKKNLHWQRNIQRCL